MSSLFGDSKTFSISALHSFREYSRPGWLFLATEACFLLSMILFVHFLIPGQVLKKLYSDLSLVLILDEEALREWKTLRLRRFAAKVVVQ